MVHFIPNTLEISAVIRQVTKYLITKIKAQLVVLAGHAQAQESKFKLIHLHFGDYHFRNDKKLFLGVFLPLGTVNKQGTDEQEAAKAKKKK